MNTDYAHCVGEGYFSHPEPCRTCRRHFPFSQPTEGGMTWVMPMYDKRTCSCPMHDPKPENE